MSRAGQPARRRKAGIVPSIDPAVSEERELKFVINAATLPALLAHPLAQGISETRRLRSVYFDTPDGDLRATGFGLRIRRDGRTWTQTLKRDLAGRWPARREWQWAIERAAVDVAVLAKTPLAKRVKRRLASLAPVLTVDVERQTRLCRFMAAEIELAVDSGEMSAGGRREPILEVELELKGGDPASLLGLARQLAADLPLRLSLETKAGRGYRLAAGGTARPRRAGAMLLDRKTRIGEAFRIACADGLAQIAHNAELTLASADAEAIHQLRVGIRRLRTAIRAFAAALDDQERADADAGLKALSAELNLTRDIDVFLAEAVPAGDGSFAALQADLARARAAAFDEVQSAIRSPRYAETLLAVARLMEDGGASTAKRLRELREKPVKPLAAEVLAQMRRDLRKRARSLERQDVASRHQLRIRVKRLRYAAELFRPVFGGSASKPARRYLAALAEAQERLGAVNDVDTARRLAAAIVPKLSPDSAFAFGRALGRLESNEPARLAGAADAAKSLAAATPFWQR